ncbi:MAG: ComEC/Rec2 family competence protein [Treponema sp.]|nr:ComEC/Rec2 family competence protein [Treponema sp.]
MKKSIEIIATYELFIFYGFFLKEKSNTLKYIFYFISLILIIFLILAKEYRKYCISGILAGLLALSCFNKQNAQIKSILPLAKAECIYCEIISSPQKINENYYSINVKLISMNSKNLSCYANGKIKVIVKSKIIQNNQKSKTIIKEKLIETNQFFLDTGALIYFYGSFDKSINDSFTNKNPVFFVNSFLISEYKNNILRMRANFRFKIKKILLSLSESGTLLVVLLLGSKDYLAGSLNLLFQRAGLAHVLALSGLHISVMCAFTQKTADFFYKRKNHIFLMILASTFFVFIAGTQPSLVRALLFIYIKSICSFYGINCKKGAIFYLSICIHILIQPLMAFSVSFLLSYSAVFGIMYISPYILELFNNKKSHRISESLSVSAGAQIGTIPFQFLLFEYFSLIGIFSSFVAVPLISLFFILGIFAIIIILIFPESLIFFKTILSFLYEVIVAVVRFFSRF